MCEPSHSIIQYSPDDDDRDDGVSVMSPQAGQYAKSSLLQNLGQWAKKINGWMHLSVMGKGHSEAIGARGIHAMWRYNDVFSLYEAHWWNRQVVRDGGKIKDQEQFVSAVDYANKVSIGNMTQLRIFLDESLNKTDKFQNYQSRFFSSFLNQKGQEEFIKKSKEVFKIRFFKESFFKNIPRESAVKFILGFTRKRDLIVPEWADDIKIWEKKLGH